MKIKFFLIIICLFIGQTQASLILLDGQNPDRAADIADSANNVINFKHQWITDSINWRSFGISVMSEIDGSPRRKLVDILRNPLVSDKRSTVSFNDDYSFFESALDQELIVGSFSSIEFYVTHNDGTYWYSNFGRNGQRGQQDYQADIFDLNWLDNGKLSVTLFENDFGLTSFRTEVSGLKPWQAAIVDNANDPVDVPEPTTFAILLAGLCGLVLRKTKN
jgi:hypothetical protein